MIRLFLIVIVSSLLTVGLASAQENASAQNISVCHGCVYGSKCVDAGFRTLGGFCNASGSFASQKGNTEACGSGFECVSNLCEGGRCVDEGLFNRILNWLADLFRGLFGGF
jgi:hypothetical protein